MAENTLNLEIWTEVELFELPEIGLAVQMELQDEMAHRAIIVLVLRNYLD